MLVARAGVPGTRNGETQPSWDRKGAGGRVREGRTGQEPRSEVRGGGGDSEDWPRRPGSLRRRWPRTGLGAGCEGERRVEAEGLAGGGAADPGSLGRWRGGHPSPQTGPGRVGGDPVTGLPGEGGDSPGVCLQVNDFAGAWGRTLKEFCSVPLLPSPQVGVALQETPVSWGPGLLLRGA